MEYFCAAITENGFYNGFSEVFNEQNLKRLYVIKGASGVGKSTLMRKIAAEGEKRGRSVDRIYCSSDPNSLDGVIVGDIGVIDGTPPHAYEPKMAGAFETLVDLGQFWDKKRLEKERERLLMLGAEKKRNFERIYELTALYGKATDVIYSEKAGMYNKEKIDAYTHSLVKRKLQKGKKGVKKQRIFSSTLGKTLLPICKKQYSVGEKLGFAPLFMDSLITELEKSGIEFFFSPELPSLRRVETVYIPSLNVVYTTVQGGRNINGERFLKSELPREKRVPKDHLLTTLSVLESRIEHERNLAMQKHYDIERIYIDAMDFVLLEKYTKSLIGEIFS